MILSWNDFEKVINLIENYENEKKALHKAGLPAYDMHTFEYFNLMTDIYLREHFDEAGLDWIYWWLYEAERNSKEAWEKDGTPIPTETVEDLWNIVKEHLI